jgi:hypothetical protein
MLESRIGEGLVHIGAAYLSRWLITEPDPGRGYFVREADRPGPGGGQFTLIHRGSGKVDPCWELFVQLADYGRLRAIAERHGQIVRLEDSLMDLTVRSGNTLILYVEHKVTAATARKLAAKMRAYGQAGFSLTDPDRHNDALRKAKYLVRDGARPRFFGLSAVNYQKLFRLEYDEGNRFRLIDDDRSLIAPLSEYPTPKDAHPEPRSPVDALAIEIGRLCRNVWVSLGSRSTAFNFYVTGGEHGDAIVAGASKAGKVWTDVEGLGPKRANLLAAALYARGVSLDTSQPWSLWRVAGRPFTVADSNPLEVAEAISEATRGARGDEAVTGLRAENLPHDTVDPRGPKAK